jgi:hypothetical protein
MDTTCCSLVTIPEKWKHMPSANKFTKTISFEKRIHTLCLRIEIDKLQTRILLRVDLFAILKAIIHSGTMLFEDQQSEAKGKANKVVFSIWKQMFFTTYARRPNAPKLLEDTPRFHPRPPSTAKAKPRGKKI